MGHKEFLQELDGRGFDFQDKSYTEFGFNDEILNMVYEMYCAGQQAQAIPEGFLLVKQVHPDSIVHNQGLGLFKECQVIYGWNGKSKEFKDALNKGFYYGVKCGAKAVLETAIQPE